MDENRTPPSIAYMKQYVEGWFEYFAKGIGKEIGMDRRLDREAMEKHVDAVVTRLGASVELRQNKLEAQIAAQERKIEEQARQIKSLISRVAKKKEAAETEYSPTMVEIAGRRLS